jgi:hypothetical protein
MKSLTTLLVDSTDITKVSRYVLCSSWFIINVRVLFLIKLMPKKVAKWTFMSSFLTFGFIIYNKNFRSLKLPYL